VLSSNFRLFYHTNSHRIFFYFFLLAFCCQIFFWKKTENIKPHFDLVPPAPNQHFVSAISFGDKEFLFRILAARLQNSGDVFAGFVSLKNYDYSRIYDWLKLLDSLNYKSNLAPSLASYYYSQTQNKPDTGYLVNYLDEHASQNPDEKWWWFFQAIYIATNSLGDTNRALELAQKMAKNSGDKAPLWTKQMPAFIYEQMGEGCMAFFVIENLIKENESGQRAVSAEEMNFMRRFIDSRLARLAAQKFDPRKCSKK
jgi:hypothetical protein